MAVLPRRHITQVIDDSVQYISDRMDGKIRPIRLPFPKLNKVIGGIEPDSVILLGAQSGAGKTAIQTIIEDEILQLDDNKYLDIEELTFNFEMKDINLAVRKFSRKLQLTTQEISSVHKKLGTGALDQIKKVGEDFKNMKIEYVDTIGRVDDIRDTVLDKINSIKFRRKKQNAQRPTYLIVSLDHTLLAKKEKGVSERDTLVRLAEITNEIKHMYKPGIYVSWILLTQTNRSLDNPERLNDTNQQFPVKSDIFGSDALWQIADVVIVLMIPFRFGIMKWGYNELETRGKMFMHILKNREGALNVLSLTENLKYNTVYG